MLGAGDYSPTKRREPVDMTALSTRCGGPEEAGETPALVRL
jgi:hypothetical protein